MKALENRTLDSKREMDIMAALDELQTLNKRQARVDTDAALAALQRSAADDGEGEVRAVLCRHRTSFLPSPHFMLRPKLRVFLKRVWPCVYCAALC